MVVHTNDPEKNLPLPAEATKPAFQAKQPTAPVTVRRRTARAKGCLYASLTFNLIFVLAVIATGLFLCRYRSKYADMKMKYKALKMEMSEQEAETRTIDVPIRFGHRGRPDKDREHEGYGHKYRHD